MHKFLPIVVLVVIPITGSACKSSRCDGSAYKQTDAKFCVNAPADYKPNADIETRGVRQVLTFKGPHYGFFEVRWSTESYDDAVKNASMIAATNSDRDIIGSGKGPDGGYFYHIQFKGGTHQLEYLYKRPGGGVLSCWSNLTTQNVPAIEKACQSLSAT